MAGSSMVWAWTPSHSPKPSGCPLSATSSRCSGMSPICLGWGRDRPRAPTRRSTAAPGWRDSPGSLRVTAIGLASIWVSLAQNQRSASAGVRISSSRTRIIRRSHSRWTIRSSGAAAVAMTDAELDRAVIRRLSRPSKLSQ